MAWLQKDVLPTWKSSMKKPMCERTRIKIGEGEDCNKFYWPFAHPADCGMRPFSWGLYLWGTLFPPHWASFPDVRLENFDIFFSATQLQNFLIQEAKERRVSWIQWSSSPTQHTEACCANHIVCMAGRITQIGEQARSTGFQMGLAGDSVKVSQRLFLVDART